MSWYYDDNYYRPSVPRRAKGGIIAQTSRGQFGKSWWGRRWIQVLEGFDIGARLSRGRKYARSGQVLSIEIEPGIIRAKVQGSRRRPYDVAIRVKTLSLRTSKALAKTLATKVMFAAQLLRGEMPANIEEAFRGTGGTLFPKERGDLKTECSCPDWSNPCKHIAAVYYLLGEAFDNDPFLIFRMRGIERDKLLSQIRSAGGGTLVRERAGGTQRARRTPGPVEQLPADPGKFWTAPTQQAETMPGTTIPRVAAALPRQLGPFRFWRGAEQFLPALTQIYSAASAAAWRRLAGE